jgi:YD repeat-containing protein
MKRLETFARAFFLLTIVTLVRPVLAECQPDTLYTGKWNWTYTTGPGSANWASCQNLTKTSMSACWTPIMLSAFCGPGYHCKANEISCGQVYMGECIRLRQNAAAFRDSDGGFCCNSTQEVAVPTSDPRETDCGPSVTAKAPPEAQCGADCNSVGHPINPANGGVFARETDIPGPIPFERFFNSASPSTSFMSPGWTHSFSRRVTLIREPGKYRGPTAVGGGNSSKYSNSSDACTLGFAEIKSQVPAWVTATAAYSGGHCNVSAGGGGGTIGKVSMLYTVPPLDQPGATVIAYSVRRDDGRVIEFPLGGSTIVSPQGIKLQLSASGSGFTIVDENDNVESYDVSGKLTSVASRSGVVQTMSYDGTGRLTGVTDSFGNSLTLGYANGRVSSATGSSSQVFQYAYDFMDRLATVTAPDTTTNTYLYGNASFENALTAVKDENGSTLSSWTYDSQGRATHTEENGGANAVTLVYNSDTNVTVTDSLGAVRTFSYERHGDLNLVSGISGSQCPTCRDGLT